MATIAVADTMPLAKAEDNRVIDDPGKRVMIAQDGSITEIMTQLGFEVTLARVTEAVEAAGLTIFARIDHAENARHVGLVMPPTTLLIYGNAKGGTPVMLAAPGSALDLPLRVLVRETDAGTVVAFHPVASMMLKAGVPESLAHKLDPAQRILEKAFQP